jgi:hypothetical protein
MSKRKREEMNTKEENILQQPQENIEIDKSWISATSTRNYILKDPLLDWLNLYGIEKGFNKDSEYESELQKKLNFTKYIMNKGIEFEKYIIDQIKDKHKENFVTVDNTHIWPINKKYNRQINETIELMKLGTNIIYQGLVYNSQNKTFGYPDLIVRSDYINKIVEKKVITDKKSKKGCKFSKEWHYRIIDIKFTTLKLKANESSLLNQGSILPYKAQTYIYNRALGTIQNFVPGKAYLLGRGWSSSKNPFDKLGQIDFCNDDKEIGEDVDSAIEWIKNVRKNGHEWNIFPKPSKIELYPNMCNDADYDWHKAKTMIANELSEITSIWQCGVKNREIAHESNVYKWIDTHCTSKLLGVNGQVTSTMIDKILEINRCRDKNKYYDVDIDSLRNSLSTWMNNNFTPSFFIDFETVSNINNIESSEDEGMIFMIGSGTAAPIQSNSLSPIQSWNFTSFTTDNLSPNEEKKIIISFLDYLKSISNNYENNICRLYHYSFAEPVHFNKALLRHNIVPEVEIEWIDLLKVIKDNKFIVKGALNFSLKSIVSALSSHKMIDIDYSDIDVCNGSQAMIAAFLANEEAISENKSFADVDIINCVKRYNEIDCLTLKSLLKLLIDITV